MRWFRKASDQGLDEGHYYVGLLYEEGSGVKRDDAEAARWYRKAAEEGLDEAQFKLATMYEEGRGVPRSATAAAEWYRRAAVQGHEQARQHLERLNSSRPSDSASSSRPRVA